MEKAHTGPLQRTISRVFPNDRIAYLAEILFLFALGVTGAALHSRLRIPLHLPGRQGLIFVAIVVFGRGMSRFSFASSLTCAGAAALLMTGWPGFGNPYTPYIYIATGIIFDLLYSFFARFSPSVLFIALASGIGWTAVPLFKLVAVWITGTPEYAFSTGWAYPFLTHFIFGTIGGLAGAGVVKLFKK